MDMDCVVVGAGVVGLAIARNVAMQGLEVLIVDRAAHFGSETSSRNSEVIHAGIYYRHGSMKARACREGKQMLYEYCRDRGVAHARCGKLIVAGEDAEVGHLRQIETHAIANGVTDLEWLMPDDVRAIEPQVVCRMALFSPSTGIIDSHHFMMSLLGDLEAHGGLLALNSTFVGAQVVDGGFVLRFGGETAYEMTSRYLVNAAGLWAQDVACGIEGLPPGAVPPLHLAKGSYFTLTGASPFQRLIYPVPVQGGLGVHATLDLAGQCRFGPDVEWLEGMPIDYRVDPGRGDAFYAAIRRYWPGLRDRALEPGYSGVRAKLSPRGRGDSDFLISGAQEHGVTGLVNLFGIESPGLTSSLFLAEEVRKALMA